MLDLSSIRWSNDEDVTVFHCLTIIWQTCQHSQLDPQFTETMYLQLYGDKKHILGGVFHTFLYAACALTVYQPKIDHCSCMVNIDRFRQSCLKSSSQLDFVSQVEFNPNQSSLTVEGDDIDAFDKVMQHISYLNSRQFPTPGIRHLRISTTVK